MKIAVLVEGATEKAFKPILENFLKQHLQQQMPKLKFIPYDGRIPKAAKAIKTLNALTSEWGFS